LTEEDKVRFKILNRTARPLSRFSTVVEWFEEQVRERPDSTALTFFDQRVSYSELNGRANQVAHHLRSVGVGLETPVGLFVDRSPEMIIGVLAIITAGGGFCTARPGLSSQPAGADVGRVDCTCFVDPIPFDGQPA
jgi:non-ribosomal peptide synthetase component F